MINEMEAVWEFVVLSASWRTESQQIDYQNPEILNQVQDDYNLPFDSLYCYMIIRHSCPDRG
jgi:hypothetical protein